MNSLPLKLALVLAVVAAAETQDVSRRSGAEAQNWSIEGIVTDSVGKPVEGAQVIAEAHMQSSTTSAVGGRYALTGSETGRYGVFASKDGYVWPRIRFVQLMSGVHVTLDLELDRESTLSGKVSTRDGNPIVGVQVNVWGREFRDGQSIFAYRGGATTDRAGFYKVMGLSSGLYYVGVNPTKTEAREYIPRPPKGSLIPQLSYPPWFYPGVQSFEEATAVSLAASEQREHLDLALDKVTTFCATGFVSYSGANQGKSGITLRLAEVMKGWGNIIGNGQVQFGKKFEFCGLVPLLPYALTAQVLGDGSKLLGFVERDFEGNKRDADLGLPLDLGVLSIESGAPVKGRVTIDGGKGDGTLPKDALVALEATNALPGYVNETRETRIAATGEFVLPNVFPYEHRLRILGLPAGYYIKQATCDRHDLLEDSWQSGCGEVNVAIGADGATVAGQAVDENGQPANTADVILVPKQPSRRISVRPVDQGGHFQFSSVIPGDYSIIAVKGIPEGEVGNPDSVGDYLSRAMDLSLTPNGRQAITLVALDISK